ncbi:MAG TPA: phospholipid-binding protein [Alphaproteobacteria bacterium]|nr:phospholipid-binding protein [Alphaproteobacteria bacterium]
MLKRFTAILALVLGVGISFPSLAGEFSFTFKWGNIPGCDNGYTYTGKSPIFTLSNVPEGTRQIAFAMKDLNVDYDHKGGVVKYAGGNIIPFGAFGYLIPCPPGGSHVYEWTAYAENAKGDILATAKSKRKYPK